MKRGGDLEAKERELLEQHVEELRRAGFLERLSKDKFAFSNNLTWEVVYKSLMFSERRRFHGLVAAYLEQNDKVRNEDIADLLLYHFEAANDYPKTVHYGVLAGDRAAKIYANQEAISSYTRAKSALEAMGDESPADLSVVLEKLADVYQSAGEYGSAAEEFDLALRIWEESGRGARPLYLPLPYEPKVRVVELLRKISKTHEDSSDYGKAEECIDRAIAHLPGCPALFASRAYSTKSVILYRKGELQRALESGNEALELARGVGESQDLAYAYLILGGIYMPLGKLPAAVSNLKKADSLYRDIQDLVGITKTNLNLGNCLTNIGDLQKATQHYDVALESATKLQNKPLIAILSHNLGQLYLDTGDIDKSMESIDQVIEANRQGYAHDALTGCSLANLSRCHSHLGDFETAERTMKDALALTLGAGVHDIYLNLRVYQSELFMAQGRYAEARSVCEDILPQLEKEGAQLNQALVDRMLGKLAAIDGDFEKAEELISKSIELTHKVGSKYEEALSTREHGEILRIKGAPPKTVLLELEIAAALLKKIGANREYGITQKLIDEVSSEQA